MINLHPSTSVLEINHKDISQVIGVAYSFEVSRIERQHLDSATPEFAGFNLPFSYFYKGNPDNIAGHQECIYLRRDPKSGKTAFHLPEAELAMLLGKNHEIIGYCLANDLTATSLEIQDSENFLDNTYQAKVWYKCGSYGPRFVSLGNFVDFDLMTISLKIQRDGKIVFDDKYPLSLRVRNFDLIPNAIINKHNSYIGNIPKSKQIKIDKGGYLSEGTLIMLGTGLIVSNEYYCKPGDIVKIYCDGIGELTNTIMDEPKKNTSISRSY